MFFLLSKISRDFVFKKNHPPPSFKKEGAKGKILLFFVFFLRDSPFCLKGDFSLRQGYDRQVGGFCDFRGIFLCLIPVKTGI